MGTVCVPGVTSHIMELVTNRSIPSVKRIVSTTIIAKAHIIKERSGWWCVRVGDGTVIAI